MSSNLANYNPGRQTMHKIMPQKLKHKQQSKSQCQYEASDVICPLTSNKTHMDDYTHKPVKGGKRKFRRSKRSKRSKRTRKHRKN